MRRSERLSVLVDSQGEKIAVLLDFEYPGELWENV
jgi:hypothetical protein